MRVIKSGVEMTPEQLTRVKGGACACGCNFSAMSLHSSSESSGSCECNCAKADPTKDIKDIFSGAGTAAATYI